MVWQIFLFSLVAVVLFLYMIPKRARNEIIRSFQTKQVHLIVSCGFILLVLLVGTVWLLVQFSNM